MPYEFKAPIAIKVLSGALAVILIAYNFVYAPYKTYKNKTAFYQNRFSSVVVSSGSFEGRTIEFQLDNGLKIYFFPAANNKIAIGDSVRKERNTYKYTVYRKRDSDEFKNMGIYDFQHLQ
jgi:hypothetical protein